MDDDFRDYMLSFSFALSSDNHDKAGKKELGRDYLTVEKINTNAPLVRWWAPEPRRARLREADAPQHLRDPAWPSWSSITNQARPGQIAAGHAASGFKYIVRVFESTFRGVLRKST